MCSLGKSHQNLKSAYRHKNVANFVTPQLREKCIASNAVYTIRKLRQFYVRHNLSHSIVTDSARAQRDWKSKKTIKWWGHLGANTTFTGTVATSSKPQTKLPLGELAEQAWEIPQFWANSICNLRKCHKISKVHTTLNMLLTSARLGSATSAQPATPNTPFESWDNSASDTTCLIQLWQTAAEHIAIENKKTL